MESTNLCSFYQAIYFKVSDRVIAELHHRFDDSREIMLAMHSSLQSKKYKVFLTVQPLAELAGIKIDIISPQLELARKQRCLIN